MIFNEFLTLGYIIIQFCFIIYHAYSRNRGWNDFPDVRASFVLDAIYFKWQTGVPRSGRKYIQIVGGATRTGTATGSGERAVWFSRAKANNKILVTVTRVQLCYIDGGSGCIYTAKRMLERALLKSIVKRDRADTTRLSGSVGYWDL